MIPTHKPYIPTGVVPVGSISQSSITSETIVYSSKSSVTVADVTTATMCVTGTFELNGVNIGNALNDIMDTLTVIKQDLDMEKRYPKLKEAYDAYNKILEDYKLIDMMKND